MIQMSLTMELLEPLLLGQPGDSGGNETAGLSFISGSVLRNALAGIYIAKRGLTDAAVDPECRRLFFDDAVLFLNALPLGRQDKPSLPVPISWFVEKDELTNWIAGQAPITKEICDAAIEPDFLENPAREYKLLVEAGGFCSAPTDEGVWGERVELVKPGFGLTAHIQREHKRHLKTKEETQVFAYRALEAGQKFRGEICLPDQASADAVQQLLAQHRELRIGKSRGAGYGLVRIDVGEATPLPMRDWDLGRDMVVTLLSDTVLRDAHGQFSTCVQEALGASQAPKASFWRTTLFGGFNQKWGMPTPQARALKAGSVFVFAAGVLDLERLRQAMQHGIGLYRGSGFGQIALNIQQEAKLNLTKVKAEPLISMPASFDPIARKVLENVMEQQLKRQLELQLYMMIKQLPLRSQGGKLTNSALMRVRDAAREAVYRRDIAPIKQLLQDIAGKAAAKSLEEGRVGEHVFSAWLKTCVDAVATPEKFEALWKEKAGDKKLSEFGEIKPVVSGALRAEMMARLIDGVINEFVKKRQTQRDQQGVKS